MTSSATVDFLIQRFKQTLKLYLFLFPIMWLMFFLNQTLLFGKWNVLGIAPRQLTLKSLIGVFLSWTMHVDLNHILNNTIVLTQILFFLGFFEKQVFKVVAVLILSSGVATWILGASYTNHVGASGLAFAMFGYILSSAFLAKRWEYIFVCIFLGVGFWMSVLQGLIPKPSVSFAGHFGGLMAGLLFGILYNKRNRRNKSNV